MLFFKKKKKVEEPIGRGYIPIERVKELSSKGIPDNEIVNILKKEGFSQAEIDSAMSQAIRDVVAGKEERREELPTIEDLKKPQEDFEIPEEPVPESYYREISKSSPDDTYIETLIEDRVSEINKKISEMNLRYKEIEAKIEAISNLLKEIEAEKENEKINLENRISELKEDIRRLIAKVESLERVFKEALPALIESVKALTDLVNKLKV
ncbi:MAG: hypothetical protein B6U78_00305 [Candidatus Aenigmarchaeota archaeon ex4484_224]|nr:MAG: hypothetical protein B6U78_00305 [Candidatus Aenigmarchaeota archaeon ex4484_224]